MAILPDRVLLCEVGPRDGFQFEAKPIPTDLKVEIITALIEAGLPRIQVTSFVHPKWVPQMADAEEVFRRLPAVDGIIYSALVLNTRGLERALEAGVRYVDLSIATNEQHSRDNVNMTVDESIAQAEEMVRFAHQYGMQPQMGFQTVFGYASPGDTSLQQIVDLAHRFSDMGVESISLADSTGMANPVMIQERVQAVQAVIGDTPLVLHLHDTRGLGLANVYAALEAGITRFDTSLGGLGGCPFIPGATGNIATEDTASMLEQMGVETGIDIALVAEAARRIEAFLEKRLPGKLHGLLPKSAPIT